MKKNEISPIQRLGLNIFNLLLEGAGWEDVDQTEKRFDNGERMVPEGRRIFYGDHQANLEARFHAPINMITLVIHGEGNEGALTFNFIWDDHPERIIEWLVSMSNRLTVDTYVELLKTAAGKCEMILLESEGKVFEVTLPTE